MRPKIVLIMVAGTLVVGGVLLLSFFFPTQVNQVGGVGNIVGALTALFTFYYVILTNEIVRQTVRAQEEESRPQVTVDIELPRQLHWRDALLVIRNIGRTAAQDLTISFSPELTMRRAKDRKDTLFSKPIAFLAPGNVMRAYINSSSELLAEGQPLEYNVTLRYRWAGRKTPVVETYTINLEAMKHLSYMGTADLSDIAWPLKQIVEVLQNQEAMNRQEDVNLRVRRVIPSEAGLPQVVENLQQIGTQLVKIEEHLAQVSTATMNVRAPSRPASNHPRKQLLSFLRRIFRV